MLKKQWTKCTNSNIQRSDAGTIISGRDYYPYEILKYKQYCAVPVLGHS
jgi:hypothetical protein